LYPHCRGEILDLLIKAVQNRDSFETFHRQVLEQIITPCQRLQLRILRYERIQGATESLAQYVQSIRETAQVLCIQESEEQIVQRIIEGLHNVQRSRFVFQATPINFKDLEHLVVVDRRVSSAQDMGSISVGTNRQESEQVNVVNVTANPIRESRKQAPTNDKRPRCYKCGKIGHIQRCCFAFRKGRVYGNQKSHRPRSLWGNKKIKGATTTVVSALEAQLGKGHVHILIDSGSVRSIISAKDFQST
jgi:hypothetical protein